MRLIGRGGLCETVVGLPLCLLSDEDLWAITFRIDAWWYSHDDTWWPYHVPRWRMDLFELVPGAPWRELMRRGYTAGDYEARDRQVSEADRR